MTDASVVVPGTDSEAILLCQARSHVCALPLRYVLETMRPLPVEPFGGAPAFVVGVSRIRGAHVPVVDLGQVLGRSEPSLATRFVLLRCESRTVALQVEGVLGVATFSPAEARDLPPLLDDAAAGPIAALGERDAALLLVLRATRLVPETLGQALEAGGLA